MSSQQTLVPELIEHIHDVLVGIFLPFDERVNPAERRDRSAIQSALGRPFQTVGGEDAYPTIAHKAAALFHSLICNHCFINGNKRTAVIALDLFVLSQGHFLTMSSDEVYEMAKGTAQANSEGKSLDEHMAQLATKIEAGTINIELLVEPNVKQELGQSHERVMGHVKRVVYYAMTTVEQATQQRFPNRDDVERFFSQYP